MLEVKRRFYPENLASGNVIPNSPGVIIILNRDVKKNIKLQIYYRKN